MRGRAASAPATHALTASDSAWIAALPCALLVVAAVALLGPPLGHALLESAGDGVVVWEFLRTGLTRPEPVEQARYLVALAGPLLAVAATLALAGRPVPPRAATWLVRLGQVAVAAAALAALVAQRRHVYPAAGDAPGDMTIFFTTATLVVAAALTLALVAGLRSPAVVERVTRAARETPAKAIACGVVAALFVLAWLLSAFNTDATVDLANHPVWENVAFSAGEAFAVLNGHGPLVDFHAQYGHLWAYGAAGGLKLLGASLGAYAGIMLAGTAASMAAVYATYRRLSGSSLLTLPMFLPFVATSFFVITEPLENRFGPANLFSLFPIRYGGPYLLLWLVVRRIQRRPSGTPLALFTLAGLVLINNLEFGLPAFGATAAALALTAPSRSVGSLLRLAAVALAGVAGAAALVTLLAVAVVGSPPDFGMLLTFPRIFGSAGFGMVPMPTLGLHLAVYATFAAAIVVAAVRSRAGGDPALTGALVWAGVFGLGAGSYFVGRSHPHVLIDLFSAWGLALGMLLLVAVPAIRRRPSRLPSAPEVVLLAAFGLMVCSLAQTPTPWSQLDRLRATQPHEARVDTVFAQAVAQLTVAGEPVALLVRLGHRIAHELGIDDVTPYANIESMMTREQWRETVSSLRRAGGTKLVIPRTRLRPEHVRWLRTAGYRDAGGDESGTVVLFTAISPSSLQ